MSSELDFIFMELLNDEPILLKDTNVNKKIYNEMNESFKKLFQNNNFFFKNSAWRNYSVISSNISDSTMFNMIYNYKKEI